MLGDSALKASWLAEVEGMRTRILAMRQELVDVLKETVPGGDFDYLLKQRGMFSYTGFSAAQVDRLSDCQRPHVRRGAECRKRAPRSAGVCCGNISSS